jgi:hypothetical protein
MTLTEFLLARIAEDSAIAERAAAMSPRPGPPTDLQPEWEYAEDDAHTWGIRTVATMGNPGYEYHHRITFDQEGLSDSVDEDAGPHIARFDPARVLRECEAKRRVIELHQSRYASPSCRECGGFTATSSEVAGIVHRGYLTPWPCPTLRILALPYADHPDYQQEWRA